MINVLYAAFWSEKAVIEFGSLVIYVSFEVSKYLLYGIIHTTHENIHTALPNIVKISPLWMPERINITPEKQNPIKAKSSNLQSLAYFFLLTEAFLSVLFADIYPVPTI